MTAETNASSYYPEPLALIWRAVVAPAALSARLGPSSPQCDARGTLFEEDQIVFGY
jgi:hypothetical protein